MPIVSAFVEQLAAEFGPVAVLFAEENGARFGVESRDEVRVTLADLTIEKPSVPTPGGSRPTKGSS